MYNFIVVGFDESESSKAALKEASLRVKKHGGKLLLVHAVYFDQEEIANLKSQMEKRLEIGTKVCLDAKKDLYDDFGLGGNVESVICEGEPPKVIVDIARGKSADLIALGTYGRKGLKRLLMGSVTSRVILNSPCDVLVVKKSCSQCSGSYHSLLVPYDGSESSKKALTKACELSKVDGAELSVLYVIPRYGEMMDFFKSDSVKKRLFQEAEKIIEGAKSIATGEGVSVKEVIQEGHAAEKIVEIADTMLHDLIVVGTHGWRGVNKVIIGSTAERVIAHASCPILIAKQAASRHRESGYEVKGDREVLMTLNASQEVLTKGKELARDRKTQSTVVKVVHPCEGDLNIRGIKRLYDALDENGAQPLSDVRRLAETQDAFIKTRGVQEDLPHRIVEVAEKE